MSNAVIQPLSGNTTIPEDAKRMKSVIFYEDRQGLFQTLLNKIKVWRAENTADYDIINARYGIVNNPRSINETERVQFVRAARVFYIAKGETPTDDEYNIANGNGPIDPDPTDPGNGNGSDPGADPGAGEP